MVETYQKENKLITTMHSLAISTLKPSIFLFIALATLLPKHVTSQIPTKPTYFNSNCYASYAGNYTKNSTYYQNLKLVLSDLVTHVSTAHFFNSSIGIPTAYAQYYCRGDISSQLCHDCVKAAVQVPQEGGDCFPVTGGAVWYQECTLQYDNKSNVGFWDQAFTFPAWWTSLVNVSDSTKFEQVFSGLINQLIKKAAYGGDPEEFATGEGSVTQYETVYCLVQCSPDITGSTCEDCLKGGLRYLANNFFGNDPEWVFLFYPKCQMRYSLSPFYPISAPSPATPDHTPSPPPGKDGKHDLTRIVAPVAAGSIFLLCGIAFVMWFCFYKTKRIPPNSSPVQVQRPRDVHQEDSEIRNIECFGFRAIQNATLNFSPTNKLGEGGFGSVYKGILSKGQLVAIKRLSINSVQGIREFKTEVAVVAKFQHRNLVRLVGYCVENEERVLVYEYLSNLSLDKVLFDGSKSVMLGWRTRFKIIEGIASGLRYLHIDSLLTIVHRDLKSSNILLDEELNPKIADFGLAKLVKVDETTGKTSRIGGTYGYMAPEYAMTGRFSIKSDIYSFGVIILEILSGKSISQFHDPVNGNGLLHHAWTIWNDRAIEGLVDPSLQQHYSKSEVERCLQIGLLCVQDDSLMRPTIRVVIGMLENQSLELPSPSAPASYFNSPRTSILNSDMQVGYLDSSSGSHFDYLHPR